MTNKSEFQTGKIAIFCEVIYFSDKIIFGLKSGIENLR